ncbi:hypothetical protein LCGC14_3055730, partial [marine sediment metagenome]
MKLTKVQEKKLQKTIKTLKDNTIDVLINDGIFVEIAREVLFETRNHFYTDSNLSNYYGYRVRANRVIPFDEKDGILRRSIEIEFKEMDTA